MQKDELLELAGHENFISGIYNYCDRWCERCPFTSRCFLYATEQADPELDDPEVRDLNNEKFCRKLESIFRSTAELITEWAAETGVDLNSVDVSEEMAEQDRKLEAAEQSELSQAAHSYAMNVEEWFRAEVPAEENVYSGGSDGLSNDDDEIGIQDALSIIRWYQFFIAVKLVRALSGSDDLADEEVEGDDKDLSFDFLGDLEFEEDDDSDPDEVLARTARMDANGSAKVALVGIDRSMGAWRILQISLPEKSDRIKPMLMGLDALRSGVEARFPHARDFIRPGLDEPYDGSVS